MNESRRDGLPQIVLFVVIIIVIISALVVGSSGSAPAATTPEATDTALSEVLAVAAGEATAEPLGEVITDVTPEAATETLGDVVADITPEATVATLGNAVADVAADATLETLGDAVAVATPAAAQRVFFVTPADHATVPTTFTVEMGAEGLTVEPAGESHADAGHFHILIDEPFIEPGAPIPNDETHLHFGKAQTSTELTLTPGEHVLRLQFANGLHVALDGDQYRDEITVTVQ